MSVYKRTNRDGTPAETYSYRFQYRGHRFSGPTGLADKRAAQAFEKREMERVRSLVVPRDAPLTYQIAASRYWAEHGQHLTNAADLYRSLGWLQKHLGAKTRLAAIDDAIVAELVARRRGESVTVTRKKRHAKTRRPTGKVITQTLRPVSNATVNRSVIEPLRAIINRANKVWKLPTSPIDWKQHKLREVQERVREASRAEERTILGSLDADFTPVVVFALLTGCRMAEVCGLRWQHVDWFNRQFTVTGKGNRSRTIPMSDSVFNVLWALKDSHPAAVFTYTAKRTRINHGQKLVKGRRYPITRAGLKTHWRRHVGPHVENYRFHDNRHTAATRLLRATGNLLMVQRLLGHSDIATTTKYAHATMEDLRKGLNQMPVSDAGIEGEGASGSMRESVAGDDGRARENVSGAAKSGTQSGTPPRNTKPNPLKTNRKAQ